MCRTGKDECAGERGFTLIEVVCILAMLTLMAAIIWPVWQPSTSRPRLDRFAVEAAALLKADRASAMRGQVDVATLLGERTLTSAIQNQRIVLPPDVSMEFLGEGACLSSRAVVFAASGLSCARRLRLTGPHNIVDLLINAATGAIEIVSPR